MKPSILPILLIAAFFGSAESAICADQPLMRAGLEYLQEAVQPDQPSSSINAKKFDRVQLLNSAKDSFAKAPQIYKGRKGEAERFINQALAQLKAGHKAEGLATIQKAIDKAIEGIALVDKGGRGRPAKAKPAESDSTDSEHYFGVPKS